METYTHSKHIEKHPVKAAIMNRRDDYEEDDDWKSVLLFFDLKPFLQRIKIYSKNLVSHFIISYY